MNPTFYSTFYYNNIYQSFQALITVGCKNEKSGIFLKIPNNKVMINSPYQHQFGILFVILSVKSKQNTI